MQDIVPPPSPYSQTWWYKNWKWLIPVVVAGAICFVVLTFVLVAWIFKSSDAYAGAMARARSSAVVIQELGEPIEPGWFVTGSISISGPTGSADFATTLDGPTGRGTLYVSADKQAGRWNYRILQVAVDGKPDRIDLLVSGGGS